MSIKKLAIEAIAVQDAANLSGIAKSFGRVMSQLWDEANKRGEGTEWVNTHPIAKLWVDKMAGLSRVRTFEEFSKAYEACDRFTKE